MSNLYETECHPRHYRKTKNPIMADGKSYFSVTLCINPQQLSMHVVGAMSEFNVVHSIFIFRRNMPWLALTGFRVSQLRDVPVQNDLWGITFIVY